MFVYLAAALILALFAAAIIKIMQLARRLTLMQHEIATYRRRTQESEKEREKASAVLAAVFAASSDAVLLIDAVGICVQANNQAARLFHSSIPIALSTMTRSPELVALFEAAREEPNLQEKPLSGEITLHSQDSRVFQAALIALPFSQDFSEAAHYVLVLKDITDLRRLETVRRDFVANVSHELRTPLSSVKAMAETLLDGAMEDPQVGRHFLETIVRETDRLVRLAADLLDLSRVETRPVVKQQCDLAPLLHDVAHRLTSQKNKAAVTVVVDTPTRMDVRCDPDEIAQVLLNLIDNAIKYTSPEGSVAVIGRREKSRIIVEVADTGIGILQQDLPRLFERFYRSDKARSRQSGGTGLGLSIVKHIIERHDGEIWVRSEYNHGSTFGFALPAEDTEIEPIEIGMNRSEAARPLA